MTMTCTSKMGVGLTSLSGCMNVTRKLDLTEMKLFTASWCAPCKVIKQELEKFENTVDIIDIDSNIQAARAAGVRSVPTLLTGDGESYTGVQEILKVIKEAYVKVE